MNILTNKQWLNLFRTNQEQIQNYNFLSVDTHILFWNSLKSSPVALVRGPRLLYIQRRLSSTLRSELPMHTAMCWNDEGKEFHNVTCSVRTMMTKTFSNMCSARRNPHKKRPTYTESSIEPYKVLHTYGGYQYNANPQFGCISFCLSLSRWSPLDWRVWTEPHANVASRLISW